MADKAVLFEQLNMPNCGRSYELTNEELGKLPADLRKRVRSGSEVDHLNQCENILRSLKLRELPFIYYLSIYQVFNSSKYLIKLTKYLFINWVLVKTA